MIGLPSRSSSFSRMTSICEPICSSPRSPNSEAGMTPSAFPPMSTTTSFWRISVMVPGTIAPSFNVSKELCASNSCMTELIWRSEVRPPAPRRSPSAPALRPLVGCWTDETHPREHCGDARAVPVNAANRQIPIHTHLPQAQNTRADDPGSHLPVDGGVWISAGSLVVARQPPGVRYPSL